MTTAATTATVGARGSTAGGVVHVGAVPARASSAHGRAAGCWIARYGEVGMESIVAPSGVTTTTATTATMSDQA
jgi:hypothetical protein